MKIKAILRFPLTPVRMTKITKQQRTNAGKLVGMGKIHSLSMDCKLVQPPRKSVCSILKSIKNKSNMWPRYSTLWHMPKGSISHSIDTCSAMLIASLFTIVRKWRQPRCPLTEKVDSNSVVHIHKVILLSCKETMKWKLQVNGWN